jgi:hypothetical protein
MTRHHTPHIYDAQRVAAAEQFARENWDVSRDSAVDASRAARGSTANLESSTCVARLPGYACTVLDFGEGVVEARAVFCDPRPRSQAKKDPSIALDVVRVETEEKREWRCRRSKRTLRYRCLALKADHMITLTKRGKFASVDEVRAAWLAFHKSIRKFPNLEFRYVAVPELHGDGITFHLHVAVAGRYDVVFLRRLWYRALGGTGKERGDETPGSINIRYFSHKRKSALIVAGYMAKYMGKSFAVIGGRGKSYWCSEGLYPLTVQRWFEPAGDCALLRVRGIVAPMAPKNTHWRIFEWEYVGLHGFVMKTH